MKLRALRTPQMRGTNDQFEEDSLFQGGEGKTQMQKGGSDNKFAK